MTDCHEPHPDTPCLEDPAVQLIMRAIHPCGCGSRRLLPVCDLDEDMPVYAIACNDCGEIEGDAPTLAEAVANLEAVVSGVGLELKGPQCRVQTRFGGNGPKPPKIPSRLIALIIDARCRAQSKNFGQSAQIEQRNLSLLARGT